MQCSTIPLSHAKRCDLRRGSAGGKSNERRANNGKTEIILLMTKEKRKSWEKLNQPTPLNRLSPSQ
jgi:hypothetical protein